MISEADELPNGKGLRGEQSGALPPRPEHASGYLSPRGPLEETMDAVHEVGSPNTKLSAEIKKAASLAPDSSHPAISASKDDTEIRIEELHGAENAPTTARTTESEDSTTSKRKVQWARRVKVKEIRHLNDITDTERDALWMSFDDHKMTKTMVKTTVMMMMRGERIDDDDPDFCTRGLEFRTKTGSRIRSQYKMRARLAVLNEQDIQRDEGLVDPEFIAMASVEVSNECQEGARQRGERDAKAVVKYLEDMRRDVCGFRI
jgi:hypothetical protein